MDIEAAGYHVAFSGQRTYNGVGLVGRPAPVPGHSILPMSKGALSRAPTKMSASSVLILQWSERGLR
jgi:hypothetical protein